jgi:hypothetical protein
VWGDDANFARAQRAYERMAPPEPDWIGTMEVKCDNEEAEGLIVIGKDGKHYEGAMAYCPFEDKAEVVVVGSDAIFDCPCCGTERTVDVRGWDDPPEQEREDWEDR